MSDILDPPTPPEPSEGGSLKARDLKNLPIILRPVRVAEEPGKRDPEKPDEEPKPWKFVECDVWVLGAGGVEQEGTGLRISWWRAYEQIKNAIGRFIPCRPVQQDDRSVILVPLKGDTRAAAERIVADVETGAIDDEAGTEPF